MKIWQALLMTVGAAIVSAAITMHAQEQPAAGDRRGNRCFNGRYWKECGTPDVPPPPVFAAAGETGGWQVVMCLTNQCVADTLNGLPFERAAAAKLTTWNSTTYVWFR